MAEANEQNSKSEELRDAIKSDTKKARGKPKKLGRLLFATCNKWIEIGKKLANPIFYFFRMIVQFEINIIFSAANTGKSMLLMQIAEEIAQQYEILVVDCELSTKQFQLRYTNPDTGSVHLFPENLLRAEINPDLLDDISLEDAIFNSVEQAAKEGIKFIAIDNLTFICTDAEKADEYLALYQAKHHDAAAEFLIHGVPRRVPTWKPLTGRPRNQSSISM